MTNEAFLSIQKRLAQLKLYAGKIDGLMGPRTTAAIEEFQRRNNLPVDGVVGPITWAALFPKVPEVPNTVEPAPRPAAAISSLWKNTAVLLQSGDVEKIAAAIDVPVSCMKAVYTVESAGKGYDKKGRVLCLYETHIAKQQCLMLNPSALPSLMRENLAANKWGDIPYPASMDGRFDQISRCAQIAGIEVALRSASWGLGQIMGFHHATLGYNSSQAMVYAFAVSEYNQLMGMATFIRNNRSMWFALKQKRFDTFASLYNGAGYRKNNYDTKLAEAERRFA